MVLLKTELFAPADHEQIISRTERQSASEKPVKLLSITFEEN